MFIPFFLELKAAKVPVSLREYLSLLEGMQAGLVDYDVEDRNGNKIGKIEAIGEDESRQPVFLSVRTGWLGMGKRHFVPAHSAEANEKSRTVRLPYDEDTVKNAPEFESEAHIDDAAESRIYEYYRAHGIAFPEYGRSDWTPSGRETETTAEKTIPLKEEELQRFRMTTHPVEFDMYYAS